MPYCALLRGYDVVSMMYLKVFSKMVRWLGGGSYLDMSLIVLLVELITLVAHYLIPVTLEQCHSFLQYKNRIAVGCSPHLDSVPHSISYTS
jgi:hypothetical protein